jgi:hypothetical protein
MSETDTERVPQASWYIPFSEIQLMETIGSGGFGEVWRGIWSCTEVRMIEFCSRFAKSGSDQGRYYFKGGG